MELKAGFKPSDVGMIPTDWHTRLWSAISNLITVGIVVRPAQYYAKQGVPALRSANIREDGIDDQDIVFISEKANALLSKSQVRAGDVLTVRTGYPGTSAVVPACFAGSNCIDILITRPSKAVNSHYLSAWINSSLGKYQVLRNQGGLAQQHFNVGDLRNLVVALPSTLTEQQAIADALNDADALIKSLEQLLAKKRQIKQGAMQELLTGKRRLPGFEAKPGYKQTEAGVIPEDWDTVRLSALLRQGPTNGWSGRTTSDSSGTPTLGLAATTRGRLVLNHETVKYLENRIPSGSDLYLAPGDVLVQRSNTIDLVGTTAVFDGPRGVFVYPDLMMRLRFKQPVTGQWFWRYANSASGRLYFRSVAAGSTGSMPKISGAKLREMPVPLPARAEQEAIADALSDMDGEIAAMDVKLTKARQIKQGMMQELLTGRIRLV
jgi:type I restriction enzyme S subunit